MLTEHYIIVGPGAVGLSLWYFLGGFTKPIVLVGQTRQTLLCKFKNFATKEVTYSIEVNNYEDLTHYWNTSLGGKTIFICTTTRQTPIAISSVCKAISHSQSSENSILTLCNGLFDTTWIPKSSNLSWYRGLVYFGASKTLVNQADSVAEVTFGGGSEIRYCLLESPVQADTERRLLEQEFAKKVTINVVKLNIHQNLKCEEIKKLFCNLVIAHEIGPRPLTNGALLTITTQKRLNLWIKLFRSVYPDLNISNAEYMHNLLDLVSKTSSNVNSFSKGWLQGDFSNLLFLTTQIRQRIVDPQHIFLFHRLTSRFFNLSKISIPSTITEKEKK